MSLGSGLRVRKDMGGHHVQEEEVYLLSPAAEQDGPSISRKSRRRIFSSNRCFRLLAIVLSFSCFALIFAYVVPS